MTKPLIKPTRDIWGANAEPMKNDETTPPCALCGAPHIGILSACYLVLRGNFLFFDKLGITVFKPDRKADALFIKLPSGETGISVDITERSETAAVIHDSCADLAKGKLAALREVTEEEVLYGDLGDLAGSYDDEVLDEHLHKPGSLPALPASTQEGHEDCQEAEEGADSNDP